MNAYNISGNNISKVSRENANIPLLMLSNSSSERILELLPFRGGLKELIRIHLSLQDLSHIRTNHPITMRQKHPVCYQGLGGIRDIIYHCYVAWDSQ